MDNGCIEHLFPSLYEEDWDVLIAHFLGMVLSHLFLISSILRFASQASDVRDHLILYVFCIYKTDGIMLPLR